MTGSMSHPVHIPNMENAKVARHRVMKKGFMLLLSVCAYMYISQKGIIKGRKKAKHANGSWLALREDRPAVHGHRQLHRA